MISVKEIKVLSELYRVRNRMIRQAHKDKLNGHVLMFHHVTDEYVDTNPSCICKIEDFKKTLDEYQSGGYEFVDVDTAIGYLHRKIQKKFAVISFDDIPEDVYTNAYPILKEKKIPFIVFMVGGRGVIDDLISQEHLQEMAKDTLCTVGAHTMNHPNLGEIDDCNWEIAQSKKKLEQIVNKPVNYFAYPFGIIQAVPVRAKEAVKEAGFKAAFCTVSAPLSLGALTDDPFFLPRAVPEEHKVIEFKKRTVSKEIVQRLWKYMIKKLG